jgi:hypothetical protein
MFLSQKSIRTIATCLRNNHNDGSGRRSGEFPEYSNHGLDKRMQRVECCVSKRAKDWRSKGKMMSALSVVISFLYVMVGYARWRDRFVKRDLLFGVLVWTAIGLVLALLGYGLGQPFPIAIIICCSILGSLYAVSRSASVVGLVIPLTLVLLKWNGAIP